MRVKMWCLTIRIKRNDQFHGKPLHKVLIEFLMEAKILVQQSGLVLMDLENGGDLQSNLKE
jgi:hypothetical protein